MPFFFTLLMLPMNLIVLSNAIKRLLIALIVPVVASACSVSKNNEAEMDATAPYEEFHPDASYPSQESYAPIRENTFQNARQKPLSTFAIDVDGASYSNVRRFINDNQLPPPDAVRIEELLNYFDYHYPQTTGSQPIALVTETSECPWNQEHRLIHIGIQGKKEDQGHRPSSNLVFLLDVSGSMNSPDKLPLLKKAFTLLLENMRKEDKVSIVVYAGAAGLVLPPTSANEKDVIVEALENLEAGGSTAGGEGILLAYAIAKENFVEEGNNRIILATDGYFNVGSSSDQELIRLIEEQRKAGIFLTVLGFGTGNYKDSKMEAIADHGNGNYFYLDSEDEAKKVLVDELSGTLYTIAKDVKIQVEFNPALVKPYRLIGYENRQLNDEEFEDDTKDAGEIGAGHTVTALYEVELVSGNHSKSTEKRLKYQVAQSSYSYKPTDELLTLKVRFQLPQGGISKEVSKVVKAAQLKTWNEASNDYRFSAAVAAYGMLLRDSPHKGSATYENVTQWAGDAAEEDVQGYRQEFIKLVQHTQNLSDAVVQQD
jgi:Ca-activated chloride channel family protein